MKRNLPAAFAMILLAIVWCVGGVWLLSEPTPSEGRRHVLPAHGENRQTGEAALAIIERRQRPLPTFWDRVKSLFGF